MTEDIDAKLLRLESELDAAQTRIAKLEAEKAEARRSYEEHVAQLSVGRVVFRKALETIADLPAAIWHGGAPPSETACNAVDIARNALDKIPAATAAATENYSRLERLEMAVSELFDQEIQGEQVLFWVSTRYKDDEVWGCGLTMQAAIDDLCKEVLDTHSFANDDTAVEDWGRVNSLAPTKTEHYERVELFNSMIRQPPPATPSIPSVDVRLLRARLIMEEALETIEALGVTMSVNPDPGGSMWSDRDIDVRMLDASFKAHEVFDLAHVAKELADLEVVTTGTFVACGIHDRPVLEAVDRNNLDKVERGTFREDGKLIKHPDHQPPDIAAVLRKLGWEG